MASFLARVKEWLLAPFASWESFLAAISGVKHALTNFGERSAWPYLLSCLGIAYLIYRQGRRRGWIAPLTSFRAFVFPREIYRHRSAVVDYKYLLTDLTLRGIVYAPFAAGLSLMVYRAVLALAGGPALAPVSAHPQRDAVLVTVVSFVLTDLGAFGQHYVMHKIPLLWHFHEVHHSAGVLTPATAYRVHPVERIILLMTIGLLGGLSAAMFAFVAGNQVAGITVLGVSALTFTLFNLVASLRHSHIWLSFGPVLSRIVISPAQHQIHHSVAPEHHEKNYGMTLAVWDAMLGSLYVPLTRETLRVGVVNADPRDFSSVPRLYLLPFRKAARHVRDRIVARRPTLQIEAGECRDAAGHRPPPVLTASASDAPRP